MPPFNIDRSKHPYVRRYKRALAYAFLGVAIGIAMTIYGLFAAGIHVRGGGTWIVTLAIAGPSVVFLSAVAFATYMENLERHSYGGSYHEPPGTAEPSDAGLV